MNFNRRQKGFELVKVNRSNSQPKLDPLFAFLRHSIVETSMSLFLDALLTLCRGKQGVRFPSFGCSFDMIIAILRVFFFKYTADIY